MTPENKIITELRQLISRLERLSVDSHWAHRAAGLRGGLLKAMEDLEAGNPAPEGLDAFVTNSYQVLEQAAREIPASDP